MFFGSGFEGVNCGAWPWRRDPEASQVQFAAVEQFPLDFFAGLQADGGGEGQREVDVESGCWPLERMA